LLDQYTNAYNNFSNTPIGFGMGLQGINQIVQGSYGLGDQIGNAAQPVIDYLTTPMKQASPISEPPPTKSPYVRRKNRKYQP